MRLTGAGLELAAATLSFGAIGVWVDRVQAVDRPVWSAGLGLVGFSFGMYRFIRLALSVSAEQREAEQREAEQREQERKTKDSV